MRNFLENWKKECYYLSSILSRHKTLEREDVDKIYIILSDYFTLDYFLQKTTTPDSIPEYSWIHFLLVNFNRRACIVALFEIANILLYLETLDKPIQKKFKSLFADPRQFRDIFFEIYISRLLDYNNIPNKKQPKEGKKSLDGICTINEKEFLCECKKLYIPNLEEMKTAQYILVNLRLKLETLNKGYGLIGTMKFVNPNDIQLKKIYENKISKFIADLNDHNFSNVDYRDIDERGEFLVTNYSPINNLEVEKNKAQYHIIFKIIPPFSIIPNAKNTYRIQIRGKIFIPQWKINRKLFSTMEEKKAQHVKSKFKNKIYFIDSESIPDFEFPIFTMDGMFEQEHIQTFINSFSKDEIVCFIRREYLKDTPKVSIKVFGKDVDQQVKQRLETLKTDFAYFVSPSDKEILRLNLN